MNDIQPSDVYRIVTWMVKVLYVMIGLIVALKLLTVFVLIWAIRVLRQSEPLLRAAERHGAITDRANERIDTAVKGIETMKSDREKENGS